ncbi:hypothetical protein WMY93_027036 [Mugilogobius chulae]|uniref:Uncharacterized protein n=1 Tax=Mugilogobius chulae TaxID=88201 RepID=A0AAW0MRT9_9GOBI
MESGRAVWTQPSLRWSQAGLSGHSPCWDGVRMGCPDTARSEWAPPEGCLAQFMGLRPALTNIGPASSDFAPPPRTSPRPYNLGPASSNFAPLPRTLPRPYDLRPASTTSPRLLGLRPPLRPWPRLHELRPALTTLVPPPRTSPRPYDLRPASTDFAPPLRPSPRLHGLRPASTDFAPPYDLAPPFAPPCATQPSGKAHSDGAVPHSPLVGPTLTGLCHTALWKGHSDGAVPHSPL